MRSALAVVLLFLSLPAAPSRAQPAPSPTPAPTPASEGTAGPAEAPGEEALREPPRPGTPGAPAPAEEPDTSGLLPRFNLYLPDGRADIRLLKPIRNSLFEMQVAYNFVSGDISAFLRYKYYGRTGTSTFSFFDTIEFSDLSRFSNEFTRTRGGLYLLRVPLDFYNRLYGLAEFDRLTFSNPLEEPDANKTNLYLKTGYQYGTPSDERSNAIVGEARDRVFNLFTALREIGPHGRGFSVAATWSVDLLGADYTYVKTEFEAIQAIPTGRNRLVLRLHGGYFPYRKRVRENFDPAVSTPFSIPRYELFSLDSRNALRGYRGRERGTSEAHLTAEYAVPFFRDARKNVAGLDWESLYAVGYAGTGNVGDGTSVYGAFRDYRVDLGAGIESSLSYRRTRVFVSALAARTVVRGVGGVRFLLSLRSYR
ncbi:MAG: hypothetical protein LC796_02040 [Acidobacteria bacterium]|nr:hypothetical protein [Acidobacteriota bacterium]MCA1611314.1 hypothetical protein [Acidobacteriota bacterium]